MGRSNLPFIIFSLLAFLPLLSTLGGPYIFTLDSVVSPTAIHGARHISDFIYGSWLTRPNSGDLTIDASAIPLYIASVGLEKVIPVFILQRLEIFLILFLMMAGMYILIGTKSETPRYFGAILYAFNPFTYQRVLAGHWLLLLGYAILPFLLKELLSRKKNWRRITAVLTLIAIVSTHTLAIAFILLLLFMRKGDIRKYAYILLAFTIINSYWIIPTLTADHTKITNIGTDDLEAFMTDGKNPIISVLQMEGYYREDAYPLPPIYITIPAVLAIIFMMIYGFRREYARLYIMLVVSAALAVGISHPLTGKLFLLLFKLPFMKGFREPQKFVMLIALGYSYLTAKASLRFRNRWVLLLIPMLFIPMFATIPLASADYPPGWYKADSYLFKDKGDFNTLYLPWHLYLDYPWVNGRIANPAQAFFQVPVIRGDNLEIGDIESNSEDPVSMYIQKANSTEDLALLNVKYIIVSTHFGNNISGAIPLLHTDSITLYENKAESSLFSESDDLQSFSAVNYTKHSIIHYSINRSKRFVIFAEGYNPRWRLDGNEPVKGYPAVLWDSPGSEVKFVSYQYLWYALSLFGAIIAFLPAMLRQKGRLSTG